MPDLGAIGSGAMSGAGAGATFGPVGAFAGAILGGVLGGFAASGDSPQEEAFQDIMADLDSLEDIFQTLPFTKEEVMQELLPQTQSLYRGAADVVAGKIGAQTGEAGIAQGQGAKDFYLQSLAPVIAQGEQMAAGAVGEYAQFFARLSENQKGQLLNYFSTKLNAAQGLPTMTTLQKTVTGALSGIQIGSNIQGDLAEIDLLGQDAERLQGIIDAQGQSDSIQKTAGGITSGQQKKANLFSRGAGEGFQGGGF